MDQKNDLANYLGRDPQVSVASIAEKIGDTQEIPWGPSRQA